MKKRTIFLSLLFVGLFLFGGCGASDLGQLESGAPENDSEIEYLAEGVPERKIIYSVDLSVYTRDLEESIETLKSNVNADEWFDYENIRDTQASFKIRIKSERLDQFVQSIDDSFDVTFYSKTGNDISLEYLDTTNRIAALEAQYDRLIDLYEDASLNEMITINERLGEIETELLALEGTLNTFDSLVDYSEVDVTIYQSRASSKSPFINRLFTSFGNGVNAVIVFFDFLLIVLATILPFILILVPTGYGIYFLIKKRKHKKEKKEPKS
ncbi:MAG: DUF4349 domain-containing protein [Tenericutes bacterium]|jgi:hypothetical protein|nr:DUF4349 domain-containing protein [Mycoplasmatota bacterium]